MKKFIVTLVMATFLLPGNVLAEKIRLAAMRDFPPFQYREGKQMTGIDVDMVREVCKRLGIEPEFKVVPWKRALKIAKKGDVTGILTALHKEERTKFLYYTTEAIHTQKNVIMARKGSGLMKVSSLDDLKSKTVGVVRGFSYGQEFDNYQGLKKTVCNNQEDMMRIMNIGRIDAALSPEKPFLFNSRRFGLQNRFEVVYVITEHPAYTVFSKAIGEKGRVLAEKFDNILKQMKKEGIEQQIIDKYMK